jgi:hypothetical protein
MSTRHVKADRLGPSVILQKRGRKVGTVRKAQWGWYPSGRCEVSRRDWQSRVPCSRCGNRLRAPGWHRGIQLNGWRSMERQLRKGACSESLHAVFNIKADVQTSAVTARVKVEPADNRWERAPERDKGRVAPAHRGGGLKSP